MRINSALIKMVFNYIKNVESAYLTGAYAYITFCDEKILSYLTIW